MIDVKSLDLVTGNVTTIFTTPLGGWIDSLTVAPSLKDLIIAYSPDPSSGGRKRCISCLWMVPSRRSCSSLHPPIKINTTNPIGLRMGNTFISHISIINIPPQLMR
jgi:hypothetical protein